MRASRQGAAPTGNVRERPLRNDYQHIPHSDCRYDLLESIRERSNRGGENTAPVGILGSRIFSRPRPSSRRRPRRTAWSRLGRSIPSRTADITARSSGFIVLTGGPALASRFAGAGTCAGQNGARITPITSSSLVMRNRSRLSHSFAEWRALGWALMGGQTPSLKRRVPIP